MIWRLMATVLLMSDTGAPSLVLSHTDWPTELQCREIIASHYQPPAPTEFNGHTVTVKISASCVPVIGEGEIAGPPVGIQPPMRIPPPLAQIVPQFFNRLGAPMLAPPCGGRLPCNYN